MKLKAKPLSKTPCFKNIHPGLTQRVQDYYEPMLASGFSAKESLQKAVETVYNEVSQELAALPPVPISGDDRFAAAWHGSPYTFEKFSTSAIGTGEGAQAYGYGLYFAGDREVAEWYKNKLGGSNTTWSFAFNGKDPQTYRFQDDISEQAIAKLQSHWDGSIASSISKAKDSAIRTWPDDFGRDVAKWLENNSDKITLPEIKGRLYKVELAPAEDEYLLWDKPLSKQSEGVKQIIKDAGFDWGETKTGGHVYNWATRQRPDETGQAASEYLHSLGIRGIKYLDGNSRSGKKEDYNYVIFSDQDVEITDRFARGESNEFTTRILEEARRADEGSLLSDATNELARVLGPEFYNRPSATARVGATEAGGGVQQTIGGENENVSEQVSVQGITAPFRRGLQSISRATTGLQGTRYYKAESEALEKFADKYEYGQDYAVFDDQYKKQTKDRGKVEGVEHDVVISEADGVVIKRKNLGVAIQDYMQRVVDHNELFPDSAYAMEGVSKKGEALYMTVTQPYVKNRTKEVKGPDGKITEVVDPITMDELVVEMKRRGFDTVGPVDQKSFERGWLVFENAAGDMISDLAPRNVLIDKDGKVSIIDPQISKAQESDRFSRPETIVVDGKERPVTNSNGQPIHSTKEGIVNFWKWFGDSKVVDEQGRPLVVYHGTDQSFDAFRENAKGVYFFSSSPGWIEKFRNGVSGATPAGENVMPVYVSAKNPFDYENKAHIKQLSYAASLGSLAISEIKKGKWGRIEDRTTLAAIKSLGFDGVYVNEDGVKNIAVFSPTQIKSATGNVGTFSAEDPDIRYSRPFNKQEAMDEIKSYGPSLLRLLSRFSSWLQPLNRRYDSLQYATSLTDEIKDVVRQMAEQSNMQRSEQNRVLSTTKEATDQWMKAGKAGDDLPQSMELAFNASLLQLYPGKSMVDQGWGDTPEAASKAWNKAVGAKQGKDFATEYSRITREFNALSPATRKAYLGVVDVMSDLRTQLHDAYLNTIDAMPVEEEKRRALRRTLDLRFRNLKGAYMPFTRHGEYVANVYDKTADGKLINSTRAATMGELRAQVALLKAQYPADRYEVRKFDGRVIHKAKENRISPALLEQMKGLLVDNLNQAGFSKVHRLAKQFLEDNVEQLSDDQRDLVKAIYKAGNLKSQAAAINALRDNVIDSYELVDFIQTMDTARERLTDNPGLTKAIDDLEQIFLDTLPDTSALKSSMHRKGTAGWSSDAIRSVLDYANRYGKSLAYMKHGRQVDQLEAEASRLAEGIINPDRSLKAQTLLKDTFENRRVVSEEEVGALGKFSTKLGSLWFLTSPSMILVQNSQPWAITVPYLAARYGLGDAVSAMTRNHVTYQLGGKFTDDKINAFDADLSRAPKDWNTNLPFSLSRFYAAANGETKAKILKSLTADEKNMLALRLGMDTGVIANSMSFEAVEYARKGASGQIGTALDTAAEKAYFFQRFGETLSRKGAYMAAFELATKAGDSFDEANRKAIRAVNETLYDYSATNRPRIISGTFGRFFGQFRTYQLQTWGHMLNLFAKGRTGDKAAIKELGLLMATNFVLAGATGLPLAGSLATLLGAVGFLMGEDDDWVKEIEEELLKTKAGQVVLKGAPMILGLDLSRRIGMEGLTHIFQGEAPAKATPKDQMNFYASQILGPAYAASAGAAFNIGQAIQDGDWGKAFEQGTPRAIASAFQAMKLNNKGLTDGSGRVIIPEDQISKWDVALMMIGVNPGQVSVAREKEKNIREVTDMVDLKKQRLAKDLERAVLDNDGAAIEKSQAAIQRFNQQYPMFGFTSQSLASRLRGAWQERAGITSRKYQAAELYLDRYDEEEEA